MVPTTCAPNASTSFTGMAAASAKPSGRTPSEAAAVMSAATFTPVMMAAVFAAPQVGDRASAPRASGMGFSSAMPMLGTMLPLAVACIVDQRAAREAKSIAPLRSL